jgi:Prion-inhibition and propagation
MAEIAGVVASCITIAGVFKLCIEALDIIQSGKRQDHEFEMLAIRLQIEKARLYTWGKSLGLADTNASTDNGPLESFLFKTLVKASLLQLQELVEGSASL